MKILDLTAAVPLRKATKYPWDALDVGQGFEMPSLAHAKMTVYTRNHRMHKRGLRHRYRAVMHRGRPYVRREA